MKYLNVCAGVVVIILVVSLSGCTTDSSAIVYSPGEAQKIQTVDVGVIKSIREVKIQEKESGAGSIGGAIAGGVLGSQVGQGKGSVVGSVLGSIAGAAAGKFTERGIGRKGAYELEIERPDGTRISIVQEDDIQFTVGEHVRLIKSPKGKYRVSK